MILGKHKESFILTTSAELVELTMNQLDMNLNSILSVNNVMIVTMKNVLESLLVNVEIFLE